MPGRSGSLVSRAVRSWVLSLGPPAKWSVSGRGAAVLSPGQGAGGGEHPGGSEGSRSHVAPSTSLSTTLTVPSSFQGFPDSTRRHSNLCSKSVPKWGLIRGWNGEQAFKYLFHHLGNRLTSYSGLCNQPSWGTGLNQKELSICHSS